LPNTHYRFAYKKDYNPLKFGVNSKSVVFGN